MNMENQNSPSHGNILGVHVSAIDMKDAIQIISEWIAGRKQNYICVTPAHAVMSCYHDAHLRSIYNASGMITPDGMAVVWLMQAQGYKNVERVYGPDLMREVCRASVETGWTHYLYGGADEAVNAELVQILQHNYPGIRIAGSNCPPFRELTVEEDQVLVDEINRVNPDIIWLGIGSPKQEFWMAKHQGEIHAPVMVGVGAAFDFISGRKKTAPRWMQKSGLEWLFRLLSEPGRLWRRYAEYPLFAILSIFQLAGWHKYD
jgi:N-acetylglucosaminyldiphosphoundecaprenol N-acetyl-beta-D-mannosaminyltransferase